MARGSMWSCALTGALPNGEVSNSLGTPPMILCAAPSYLVGKPLAEVAE